MREIKPLGRNILAKKIEGETKTASGIVLVKAEKSELAEVVAVGAKIKDIAVGDTIIFQGFSPSELKLDGETYLTVSREDVFGIVSDSVTTK